MYSLEESQQSSYHSTNSVRTVLKFLKYMNFRYLKVSLAEKRIKVVISYKTELPFPQIFAGNARP